MAASGNRLKLFASPWSPPAFMKHNNDMLHGGHLRADVMAVQRWESCVYQAGDERYFLKNHLGPVMVQQGLRDVNIIVRDHNRDLIIQRAQTGYGRWSLGEAYGRSMINDFNSGTEGWPTRWRSARGHPPFRRWSSRLVENLPVSRR